MTVIGQQDQVGLGFRQTCMQGPKRTYASSLQTVKKLVCGRDTHKGADALIVKSVLATTMQFHRRRIWSRVFLPTLVALPITSLALMTQPVQQAASPCWYPTVASSTAPYNGAPADIHPTAIPGLSRRQSGWRKPDTLGWNDSLTCNVGVCNPTGYCTVFASHSPRDSVVTGICCPTYDHLLDAMKHYNLLIK